MHYDIVTDTETGGLYPSIHALLSIGATCSWNLRQFLIFITPESQPGKCVDPEAIAKNGYSAELWKERGAVTLEEGLRKYLEWLDGLKKERPEAVIWCHHLAFDKGFLSEAARVTGLTIPHRHDWRCTQVLFGHLMDRGVIERGSSSLDRLMKLCGRGERGDIHCALADACATSEGLVWLREKDRLEAVTLRELYTGGLRQNRMLESALDQIAVWSENGQKQGRPIAHLLEEMTLLAKDCGSGQISGAALVCAERFRQIHEEQWTAEHDAQHVDGQLRDAGIAYAMLCDERAGGDVSNVWPWEPEWLKPSDNPVRNLVKAAALFIAEIDRLIRKEGRTNG